MVKYKDGKEDIMGEMADYYKDSELYIEDKCEENEFENFLKQYRIWTKSDETMIFISQMTNYHIKNSIKMLKQNKNEDGWRYKALWDELNKRNKNMIYIL